MSKVLKWLGLLACIILIISCFLPWAYYADINQTFTGFYSYKNEYGKPGMLFVPATFAIFIFMILPKIWAKRVNLFLCAILVAYSIKTYVMFTSCYNAYCPEKLSGIFIMLVSTIIMLIAAFFPEGEINKRKAELH